jgi:MFS family permease
VFYFYVSGSIDGLTSCMFSQSQAYISDIAAASQKDLSVALSQFQGLAIGLAFMLGIPLGGYLGARYSSRAPLYVSMALCVACSLLIWWALPETVDTNAAVHPSLDTEPWWRSIYPARALSLLTRTKQLRAAACCYYLLNFAHAGIQIVWMNYLQRVFGWPAHISALTLAIVGLTVAVLPKLFIPRLGVRTSIKLGLLLHGLSLLLIGTLY